MKKIWKWVGNIFTCFLLLIIALVFYNFIQLKVLNRPYATFFGYTVFEVASGSMEPTISEKDLVIVHLGTSVKNDDIITYESNHTYITHRIIDIQGDFIIARGDANNSNDTAISKSMVLGKVVKIIPNFGVWRAVFLTPKVFVSLAITIILFIIGFSCKKQIKKCIDFSISRKHIIEEYAGDNK